MNTARLEVPVIIVGNITAGGSGKTPLVTALISLLKEKGYKPGIISRGYGGKASVWPQQVRPDSDPVMVGDEPVLLARNCQVPMAVGPDRVAAARALLDHNDVDVIVSDDGMQHYALGRDIEIAVIDGIRRLGNGFFLPAGPLREPKTRLDEVDFIIANGLAGRMEYSMQLTGVEFVNLSSGETKSIDEFIGKEVHAAAGIGNPDRFFTYLEKMDLHIHPHPFPDHYAFKVSDLDFGDNLPVVMTEKDAVKCKRFSKENYWYMPVTAKLDERMVQRLLMELDKKINKLAQTKPAE